MKTTTNNTRTADRFSTAGVIVAGIGLSITLSSLVVSAIPLAAGVAVSVVGMGLIGAALYLDVCRVGREMRTR